MNFELSKFVNEVRSIVEGEAHRVIWGCPSPKTDAASPPPTGEKVKTYPPTKRESGGPPPQHF